MSTEAHRAGRIRTFAMAIAGLAASTFAAGYTPTAEAHWSYPLQNGSRGSAWCVCRSIGTSPHIGQDWTASGTTKYPLAVEGGKVTSTGLASSSCGYYTYYTDRFGGLWRYLHLNNSGRVAAGTTLVGGNRLGYISAYPTSGCGTGPHLHLERRSAGYWGDRPVYKSCEAGPEACYYNPNKPSFSKLATLSDTSARNYDEPVTLTVNRTEQAGCKLAVAEYPMQTLTVGQLSPQLKVSLAFNADKVNRVSHIAASAQLANNAGNACTGGGCLSDWTLYADLGEGIYARVFYDNAVRGQKVERLSEEGFCAIPSAKRYLVRATTLDGKTLWQEAAASAKPRVARDAMPKGRERSQESTL